MNQRFDLAIIGGGPAGYVAAERASAAGLRVVLFERRELGGVCLNEGCIPTKTLLYGAKTYVSALSADKYGVCTEGASFDYGRMVARKNKVVRKLVLGVKAKLADIEVVRGSAVLQGRSADGFEIMTESGESFTSQNVLLCTGAEAVRLPIPGAETALTSREILELKELPKSLAIIGGGVIGMEFASLFNSLGVEVSVVEQMDEILGANDQEISELARSVYAKKGVDFHLSSTVTRIEDGVVFVTSPQGERQVVAEKVLVSVGRRPNVQGIGLETLDIQLNSCRGVAVDDRMRTNVEGVYAAGDVTGFSMLAHTAYREAEVAVNQIVGVPDRMNYNAVPGVVYINPEVASVGLTLAAARAKGLKVKELRLPMSYSGRFVAENEGGEGICKVVVIDSKAEKCPTAQKLLGTQYADGQVVGVHIIGNPASEIIWGVSLALEQKMTVDGLRKVIFPHPTVSEIIRETAFL